MLKNLTVSEFTKVLESKDPTPGGGSASALSFSLASSLLAMVLNLTIGHSCSKNYSKDVIDKLEKAKLEAEKSRIKAIDLMEADAHAFDSLLKSYKMPKTNKNEIKKRKDDIEFFKNETLRVPYEIVNEAFKMYKFIKLAVTYGNKNAISDAAVSAMLLHSAIEGAGFNVFINLPRKDLSLDEQRLKDEISSLISESKVKKEDIVCLVKKTL